jgi:spore maturation protein CgeB
MKNVQYYMMVYNRSKEGERNMNILFFQWFAFMQKGIENALKKMNVSYDVFYYDMKDWDNDDELERKLSDYLKNSNVTYDAVFSVNFIPMVSDVCSRLVSEFNTDRYRKLKYISWVYDCPVNIRKTDALKNDCNIIYFFDRIQAESYAKQGVRGAGHMPLAVDTDIFAEAINNAFGNVVDNVASNVGNSCISDVAFVGKLYRSDYQYISKYQDEYTRGYLEGIVSTQEKIYGGYVIDDCVNDNIMKCINDNFAKVSGGTYSVIKPEVTYAQLRLQGESVIRHLRCCRTGAGLIFIQLIRMRGCQDLTSVVRWIIIIRCRLLLIRQRLT